MYYPLLRGRQNELLAIKELLDNGILKGKVVPIIEPVKLSPTLVNTLEDFVSKNYWIVLIGNPKVGSFGSDARNPKNEQYKNRIRNRHIVNDLPHEMRFHPDLLASISEQDCIDYMHYLAIDAPYTGYSRENGLI